jgi:tetratricopeptide (TPR) repeat protein
VLAIYIAVAWVVLQAVEVLTSSYGLPPWFPALAAALLLMGLPFVLATAFVQEGVPIGNRADPTLIPEASDPTLLPDAGGPSVEVGSKPAPKAGGLHGLFNWRNAILIGAALFAIWGVVSLGWLFTGFKGLVVKAEAADFFTEADRVLVVEFVNQTEQAALGLAVKEAVVTDLDQSEYVYVVSSDELEQVLERMRLPDTTVVNEDTGLEIARREGYPALVAGEVTRLGSGYQITARIIESSTREVAVRLRETAANEDEVVATVEQLSRLLRRHLGESLTSLQRSLPLPQVTTASLEALELYAQGRALQRKGDAASAIPLMEQAVAIDTAFASAYRGLSVAYGNIGNTSNGQINADKAYRHAERLVDEERYMTGAMYHAYRRQLDSTVYYYQLVINLDPEHFVAVNNLGDIYERMGRYEEALPLYRLSVELDPTHSSGYVNVSSVAGTLGLLDEADSAIAEMHRRFPGTFNTLFMDYVTALRFDDLERAEASAEAMTELGSTSYTTWAHWNLSGMAAMRGQVGEFKAQMDLSLEQAIEASSAITTYVGLQSVQQTALAAGMPELIRPYLEVVREQATADPSHLFGHFGMALVAEAYATLGDLDEARNLLARLDSMVESGDFQPYGVSSRVRALIALLENRPEESLEHLNRSRTENFGVNFRSNRLLLGDTYAALGRLDEAAAHYDTLTMSYLIDFRDTSSYGILKPLGHERAASTYLAVGDTTAAVKHLAAFAELWQDADPELRPRVESAQRTLAQLAGEGR